MLPHWRRNQESILKSLSSGIIALDGQCCITKVNEAGCAILQFTESQLTARAAGDVFYGRNGWVMKSVDKVRAQRQPDISIGTDLILNDNSTVAINMTPTTRLPSQ